MKKQFPGHFARSNREIKALWASCVFVFDANILLNLYRYSDKTRNEFLRVLDSVKDRIWLPHRAGEEFFANRLNVIGQQENSYDETIRTIDALREDLENARQHPFVSDRTMKRVHDVFDILKKELTDNQRVHTNRISDDSIQTAIAKVFKDRVGEPCDRARVETIFDEGGTRYAERIPPGFRDQGKADENATFTEKCRRYGDLIVWHQILDYAQSSGVGVILVTDDKKDDWWQTFKGKTIGPRPELVQEFLEKTKQSFHMYQADRFFEFANEYLEQEVTEGTLSEIREVRRRDIEAHRAALARREREMARRMQYEALCSESEALRERMASLVAKREELVLRQHILEESLPDGVTDLERIERQEAFWPQTQEIKAQIQATQQQLEAIEAERHRLRSDMFDAPRSRRLIEHRDALDGSAPRRRK